ncbi:hypothetical protein KAI46_05195 [bacterium]|nr:hypothetical protein [bacterium]
MKIKACCNFEKMANELLEQGDMVIIGANTQNPVLCIKTKGGTSVTIPNCPHCTKQIKFST